MEIRQNYEKGVKQVRADYTLKDEKKKLEEWKAGFEPLAKPRKETLGDKVEKVFISSRSANSPLRAHGLRVHRVCEHGAHHEAQGLRDSSMTSYTASKKTMAGNPKHSITAGRRETLRRTSPTRL